MSIILHHALPAAITLRREGCAVGFLRPGAIRVALLNLMPDKIRTETQFARCLSGAGAEVELVLARLRTYTVRHAFEHVHRFYTDIHDVLAAGVDGLIVTGAPVETMPFEAVDYWDELSDIVEQAGRRVAHRLYVCWAAQAALYARHGVPKVPLGSKAFGIFDQRVVRPDIDLMSGLGLQVPVPVSRHTDTRIGDLEASDVTVLAVSQETGPGLAQSHDGREVYSFNHFEYDHAALWDEYRRDLLNGSRIARPRNYFLKDDPTLGPDFRWGVSAARFFANWLARVDRDRARTGARRGHDSGPPPARAPMEAPA